MVWTKKTIDSDVYIHDIGKAKDYEENIYF